MKVFNVWFGHGEGRKDVELSLEMSSAVTLRLVCAGMGPVDALRSFLTQTAQKQPEETQAFVSQFLAEITTKLDLQSLPLDIKSGFEGDPLDFSRPSPSWLMLKRFLEGLGLVPHFQRTVQAFRSTLPHYISNP